MKNKKQSKKQKKSACYKKLIKRILRERRQQVKESSTTPDWSRLSSKEDSPDFFYHYGTAVPLWQDSYIQRLWQKYGIPSIDKTTSFPSLPYLWFEELPLTTPEDYEESLKDLSLSQRLSVFAWERRYPPTSCPMPDRTKSTETIAEKKMVDYKRLAAWQETNKSYSFDVREIWDLDRITAYFLYPRVCYFAEVGEFWCYGQEGKKFYKQVVKPIKQALEWQLLNVEHLVRFWSGWEPTKEDQALVQECCAYVRSKIDKGYKLWATHHREFIS